MIPSPTLVSLHRPPRRGRAGHRLHRQRRSAVTVEDGRILFTSTRDGGDRDIFIADNDGSNPVNLTEGSPAEDHDPVIREDGDRIVFVSDRDGGDSDIFVMNVDGSDPVNLTSNSTSEDREPVIAGKLRRWIFFSSNRMATTTSIRWRSTGRPSPTSGPWRVSHRATRPRPG